MDTILLKARSRFKMDWEADGQKLKSHRRSANEQQEMAHIYMAEQDEDS